MAAVIAGATLLALRGRTNSKPSRTLHRAGAAMLVVACGSLSLYLGLDSADRDKGTGERAHDFGTVLMTNPAGEVVSHGFLLTNATERSIQIDAVRSTCGCTDVTCSPMTVEPGGEVRVVASMKLASPGLRTAKVFLDLGTRGVQVLDVSATGRLAHELRIAPQCLPRAGANQRVLLVATSIIGSPRPPSPEIDPDSRIGMDAEP